MQYNTLHDHQLRIIHTSPNASTTPRPLLGAVSSRFPSTTSPRDERTYLTAGDTPGGSGLCSSQSHRSATGTLSITDAMWLRARPRTGQPRSARSQRADSQAAAVPRLPATTVQRDGSVGGLRPRGEDGLGVGAKRRSAPGKRRFSAGSFQERQDLAHMTN